jgi:hypothetical protein
LDLIAREFELILHVQQKMLLEVAFRWVALEAEVALERLLSCVRAHVN